ncbi:unnamed protein product [Didymodactylos carnosus]|uniref:Uncharacterized protein n=1 Tax=Didymodactylos carnosus TaxID=1234261 RepID=A0A8S2XBH5_9BILA|nr:unnamed protein product [Didymodactylos carnosus]
MLKLFQSLVLLVLLLSSLCSSDSYENINKKLKTRVSQFLATLAPGKCAGVILNKTNSYLFSPKLSGRILPAGTFVTPSEALEYLYGILCAIPGSAPRPYTAISSQLNQITYDAQKYLVGTDITLQLTQNKKLTFFVFIAFDKNYALCGYDGQIRNIGLTLDQPTKTNADTIEKLCVGIQKICIGNNTQYKTVKQCITFMTKKIPFSTYDRLDQNNVICRTLHIQLAVVSPTVHCPHVGPTGGGKCTDKTSESYYQNATFLSCAAKR